VSGDGALAAALRRAFDERFAAPPEIHAAPAERVLVVGVDGARLAVRLGEIAGVHAVGRVVRLPGGSPGFLGLTGVRGRVLPVFDLAVLTGAAANRRAPRWIVEVAAERVGLAVDALEGHVELSAGDLVPASPRGPHEAPVMARAHGALVPVVDVGAVVADLARRAEGSAAR
jgi:purine-binding chemotaxis protein CheW